MTDRHRLALRASPVIVLAVGTLAAAAPALAAPATVALRVEGASQTIFEGSVLTDGHVVTPASGDNHKCDGTNNGANPNPGPTPTSALDDGAKAGAFTWDGQYFASFDDYLIDRIGPDSANDSQFWGQFVNSRPSETGGCQEIVKEGDEVLWAFDAFSKSHVLRLAGPGNARTGEAVTVRVTDGQDGSPQAGASVAGATTGPDGTASVSFADAGIYRLKAERADSVRSNVLVLCVDPPEADPCTSTDRVAPSVRMLVPGGYASETSRSRTFLASWQGDDGSQGSGVAAYRLEVREVGSADWRTILGRAPVTRAHFRGESGRAYEFRVSAFDRAANQGVSTGERVIVPIDDRDRRLVDFSHGWSRLQRSGAWGRFVVRSRRAGAAARTRFSGRRIALIGRRLPTGGRLRISIDGHEKVLSLRGAPRFRQVLYLSAARAAGPHRLRLEALGGGPVEIDALAPVP